MLGVDAWVVAGVVVGGVAAVLAGWAAVTGQAQTHRSRTIIEIRDPWVTPAEKKSPYLQSEGDEDRDQIELHYYVSVLPPGAWRLRKHGCVVRRGLWPWQRKPLKLQAIGGPTTDARGPKQLGFRYRLLRPDTQPVYVKVVIGLEPAGHRKRKCKVEVPPWPPAPEAVAQ